MDFFPTGLLIAFFSLTVGVLVWQRIAHYSFVAMGLTRLPPPPPSELRSKGVRFLVCAGSGWFATFAGCAVAVALSPRPLNAGVYVLAGLAAVPVLVAPGALKAIRRFDLQHNKGAP